MKPRTQQEHWTALARAIAKHGVSDGGKVSGYYAEAVKP